MILTQHLGAEQNIFSGFPSMWNIFRKIWPCIWFSYFSLSTASTSLLVMKIWPCIWFSYFSLSTASTSLLVMVSFFVLPEHVKTSITQLTINNEMTLKLLNPRHQEASLDFIYCHQYLTLLNTSASSFIKIL